MASFFFFPFLLDLSRFRQTPAMMQMKLDASTAFTICSKRPSTDSSERDEEGSHASLEAISSKELEILLTSAGAASPPASPSPPS